MNDLKSKRCDKLHSLYKETEETEIRNRLYNLCYEYVIRCLKQMSKRSLTEYELISMSWDAFLVCINKHEKNDDFRQSISSATRETINGMIAKESKQRRVEKNIGTMPYPEKEDDISHIAIKQAFIEIKDFRSILPKNYQIIFDDCLLSFGEDKRTHVSRVKKAKIPKHRYYEAKKILKWIAGNILGRKDMIDGTNKVRLRKDLK